MYDDWPAYEVMHVAHALAIHTWSFAAARRLRLGLLKALQAGEGRIGCVAPSLAVTGALANIAVAMTVM
jgi:hypothetical protein